MNILFVFADQMHRFALGCMGTPDIHTPNLDRLAAQGTLFTDAYSNCPICTPYRISLMTGHYTSRTGTFANEAAIPKGMPTLPSDLRAAGYTTSYIGKWHIGGKGNNPVRPEHRAGFEHFIGYQCYNGFLRDTLFFDEQEQAHAFEGHRTDVTTDLALQRLERIADHRFAMFVSYQAPHYPVQPGPAFEAMYRGKTIQRRPNSQDVDPYTPTFSPPSPKPRENCPDYQRYGGNLDEYLRLYYGLVSQVDHNVGRLLTRLDELGLTDSTAVIFTSDHGDMQGSHGLLNKCLPFEESAGVPLIMRIPGGPSGQRIGTPVSSGIDTYPTCLDLARLPAREDLPGASYAGPVRGARDLPADRPVFSEFRNWQMVRQGPWKLVIDVPSGKPTGLYNLQADPYEMHNRVDDPAESQRIGALAELIARELPRSPVAPS